MDLVAILTHILRALPENAELVQNVLLHDEGGEQQLSAHFLQMLKHANAQARERMCYFLAQLAKSCAGALAKVWDNKFNETVEALVYDSFANVRNVRYV